MNKPLEAQKDQSISVTGLSQNTRLDPQKQSKVITADYLIIALIFLGFIFAGTMQFVKILGLAFTPKIYLMPLVMALVFSIVVTRLRIIERRLKYERDQKDFAKTQAQVLNHRLSELLDQRTELLIEAQDQVALAQSRADLGAMSAGVIHDLNNALTSIKMGWKGLEYAEDEEIEECQDSLSSGIERAVMISQEFRSFIRPEATVKQTEAEELCNRLISMLRRSIVPRQSLDLVWGKPYSLSMTPPEWQPGTKQDEPKSNFKLFAKISEAHLTQILMNLIVNARDALNKEGGKVQRVISSNPETSTFKVIDNGSGMPAELQQKLFEPFFTTKAQGQGTGLGLHVINNLVQRAHGQLDFESVVDQGTQFTITLPQAKL